MHSAPYFVHSVGRATTRKDMHNLVEIPKDVAMPKDGWIVVSICDFGTNTI